MNHPLPASGQNFFLNHPNIVGFLRGGVQGGVNGALRIPREDWGTLGNIRGITAPLKNPINIVHQNIVRICANDFTTKPLGSLTLHVVRETVPQRPDKNGGCWIRIVGDQLHYMDLWASNILDFKKWVKVHWFFIILRPLPWESH